MGKLKLKYQIEFDEYLRSLNNYDLFYFVLECCEPDDYDGDFTVQGIWKRNYAVEYLADRLESWLIGDFNFDRRD